MDDEKSHLVCLGETRKRRIGAIETLNCETTLTGMSIAHFNQNPSVEGLARRLSLIHDYGADTMVHHATDMCKQQTKYILTTTKDII